jgi:hypothetical protein
MIAYAIITVSGDIIISYPKLLTFYFLQVYNILINTYLRSYLYFLLNLTNFAIILLIGWYILHDSYLKHHQIYNNYNF